MLNYKQNNNKNYSPKLTIANNLKNNLAYLIKKYNIDNETLAKCTGLANSTIASLRSRATNPTILTLQPLSDFFNITIDQLINQDCSSLNTDYNQIKQSNNIFIPIIDIFSVDKWPFEPCYSEEHNLENNPDKFVNTTNDINNFSYALKLDSEVLMPSYQKNTVFIVDPQKQPQDSNIVIVSLDDSEPAYRQVFLDAGNFYFKPVNPDFGGMQATDNYKIFGVIIRAIYEFK